MKTTRFFMLTLFVLSPCFYQTPSPKKFPLHQIFCTPFLIMVIGGIAIAQHSVRMALYLPLEPTTIGEQASFTCGM